MRQRKVRRHGVGIYKRKILRKNKENTLPTKKKSKIQEKKEERKHAFDQEKNTGFKILLFFPPLYIRIAFVHNFQPISCLRYEVMKIHCACLFNLVCLWQPVFC